MSYDIKLRDPVTRETLRVDVAHHIRGGTYQMGGTQELWLNITYNYAKFYQKVFGTQGIRAIYNMTGAESIPFLKDAISKLGDDTDPDYWAATEGNAKTALYGLLAFAQLRPDGVWDGD